jgi:hypothetical protein
MASIFNRIAPAAAQRFKNLAPAVWNAAKEGVVQGAKNGVKSLLRPTAKSKYLSTNSITNLAHPPGGNIQALIDENIEAARIRQGSDTPFLNTFIGKNRVQRLQKGVQKNTTRRSSSPPPALWNMKTRKRFQELAAQKMPNKGEDPMPISLKNVEEQAENPAEMMGGRRRRRSSSKSRSTRRRRAASRPARPS